MRTGILLIAIAAVATVNGEIRISNVLELDADPVNPPLLDHLKRVNAPQIKQSGQLVQSVAAFNQKVRVTQVIHGQAVAVVGLNPPLQLLVKRVIQQHPLMDRRLLILVQDDA